MNITGIMLKKLEKKEAALTVKLKKEKMAALCETITKGGYDIDCIRKAVETGGLIRSAEEKSDAVVQSEAAAEISNENERIDKQ